MKTRRAENIGHMKKWYDGGVNEMATVCDGPSIEDACWTSEGWHYYSIVGTNASIDYLFWKYSIVNDENLFKPTVNTIIDEITVTIINMTDQLDND